MYFKKSIIYLLLFIIIFNLSDIINKKSIKNNFFSRFLFSNSGANDKVNYIDKGKKNIITYNIIKNNFLKKIDKDIFKKKVDIKKNLSKDTAKSSVKHTSDNNLKKEAVKPSVKHTFDNNLNKEITKSTIKPSVKHISDNNLNKEITKSTVKHIYDNNLNKEIAKSSVKHISDNNLNKEIAKSTIKSSVKHIFDNNLNKEIAKSTIKHISDNNLNKEITKSTVKHISDNETIIYPTHILPDEKLCSEKYVEENINNDEIVLYKHKKISKYLLNDIYDNFFKKYKYKIDDIEIDKNLINIEKINNIILNDNQNNISLNKIDNFIIYNFQSKKNVYYKIKCKCKLKTNNLKNIKLIISNNKKRFMYNYTEHNCIDKIYEYGFILDYNIFDTDDQIYIYLVFYNDDENEEFLIDSIFLEVIENTRIQKNNSIIIFNINNKYNPLYLNTKNILEYLELTEESSIFFI